MKIHRIRSLAEFQAHCANNHSALEAHRAFLTTVTPPEPSDFTVPGYSYTAGKQVDFLVDYQHSGDSGVVNWRERVACPETYFNNRMRAAFHLFDFEMNAYPDSAIYVTEQVTPIYKYFASKFSNVTGSEYFGENVAGGWLNADGVRHENLCNLSFADASFDAIVSMDVLEHIPNFEKAFSECARVLKPGARMLWTAPFVQEHHNNFIRAKLVKGEIVHLQPPEYHGDPMSNQGVLCFQHFGWEAMGQMRAAGFSDAYALCFHSAEMGYLGGEQYVFVAVK